MDTQVVKHDQSAGGRPIVMTDDVVRKLEAAFQHGFSISTACQMAHIARSSFYKHYQENEAFSHRMDDAQNFGKKLAGQVVMQHLKKGDKQVAMWWLEKQEPEKFGRAAVQVNTQVNNTQNNFYEKAHDDSLQGGLSEVFAEAEGVPEEALAEVTQDGGLS